MDDVAEVSEILNHRYAAHGREFLIKWKGFDECEWIVETKMRGCQELIKEYCKVKGIQDIKKCNDEGCINNYDIGVEYLRTDEKRGLIFALYFPDGRQYWCDLETMRKAYPKLLIDYFERNLVFDRPSG